MIPDRPRDSQTSDSDSDGPILYRDEEEEEEEEDEDSNSMSHNYEKNSMFDNSHVSCRTLREAHLNNSTLTFQLAGGV